MTRLMPAMLAAALLAAPFALGPILAQDAAAPAATSGKFTAVLLGDLEVGDDGDPDGKATATIAIDGGKLCYDVDYHKIAPVTMAHIHAGAAGKAGDPVVTLKPDADEYLKGCTAVTPEIAAALLANPGDYYVNVHTNELPKGAIRGQLSK